MIRIVCSESVKSEIQEMLLRELASMFIYGMSLPDDDTTYEAVTNLFQSEEDFKIVINDEGVYTAMGSSDETASFLAGKLLGKFSYYDGFGCQEIEEISNKIIQKYPEAMVEATFEYEGNAYFVTVNITTEDGEIVAEYEEG